MNVYLLPHLPNVLVVGPYPALYDEENEALIEEGFESRVENHDVANMAGQADYDDGRSVRERKFFPSFALCPT